MKWYVVVGGKLGVSVSIPGVEAAGFSKRCSNLMMAV